MLFAADIDVWKPCVCVKRTRSTVPMRNGRSPSSTTRNAPSARTRSSRSSVRWSQRRRKTRTEADCGLSRCLYSCVTRFCEMAVMYQLLGCVTHWPDVIFMTWDKQKTDSTLIQIYHCHMAVIMWKPPRAVPYGLWPCTARRATSSSSSMAGRASCLSIAACTLHCHCLRA